MLTLALSYGGREEIVARGPAAPRPATGPALEVEDLEAALWTAGLPRLDLLVRTSGERRISNFLLWQAPTPSCSSRDRCGRTSASASCFAAIADYQARERRFGLTARAGGERPARVTRWARSIRRTARTSRPRRLGASCSSRSRSGSPALGGLPFALLAGAAAAVAAAELVLMFGAHRRRRGARHRGGRRLPRARRRSARERDAASRLAGLALAAATVVAPLRLPVPARAARADPAVASALVVLAWLYCGLLIATAGRAPPPLRRGLGHPGSSWSPGPTTPSPTSPGTPSGGTSSSSAISPKKTWEGFAGGAAGSVVGALVVQALLLPAPARPGRRRAGRRRRRRARARSATSPSRC